MVMKKRQKKAVHRWVGKWQRTYKIIKVKLKGRFNLNKTRQKNEHKQNVQCKA